MNDAYWEWADEIWAEWQSAGCHRDENGDPILPPDPCYYGEYWEDCHDCPFFNQDEECKKEVNHER